MEIHPDGCPQSRFPTAVRWFRCENESCKLLVKKRFIIPTDRPLSAVAPRSSVTRLSLPGSRMRHFSSTERGKRVTAYSRNQPLRLGCGSTSTDGRLRQPS
jgi:hypothetical protein